MTTHAASIEGLPPSELAGCSTGTSMKGSSRRLKASFRRALHECSGTHDYLELSRFLRGLQFAANLAVVRAYDAKDAGGFTDLLELAAALYPGKRECAELFGVAHSTFYRWKAGDVVPHALMRAAVRERLLDRMTGRDDAEDGDAGSLLDDRGRLVVN